MNSHFASCILFLTILNSCGHSSTQSASTADSDSVMQDVKELPVVKRLPDTIYESAGIVKYSIERCDTAVSGVLSSLADMYASAPGTLTFRNGPMRQADFQGRVKGEPKELVVDWTFHTQEDYTATSLGSWGGGSGWTGQPLYVEWPDSCLSRLRASGAMDKAFTGKEIIVGSLFGSVYFIDYVTGQASRKAIPVGNPIKGTVSLDPTLNGNLYVGQGVPARRPFGALAINLFDNEQFHFFAEDTKAQRRWGAYDSSPVRVGQFLFRPGENGGIYKLSVSPDRLTMHSVLRYTVGGAAPGIEASMAVYANYGFTADNHGNILAINLDTMKPVWAYKLGDDTDATPVIAVENGVPYLYVGCEIDLQDAGAARFVKLNATDGTEVWRTNIDGRRMNIGKKHFDGGFYSSALLGSGDAENLIFANCVKNTKGQNGTFVAMDRKTGSIVYETPLKYYAWSSPVGFLNEKGRMFVVTGDCSGNLYIINARDGKVITTKSVGNNFESSPVVKDNSLVVGSRGNSIFKISLK